MQILDVHGHFVPRGWPDFASRFGDARWPVLAGTRIVQGGRTYREIDESYLDVSARCDRLDRLGIHRQVLSPLPVMLPTWAPPDDAAAACRSYNDLLTEAIAEAPERLQGFGMVPLQDVTKAIQELEHITASGLSGVEIGTAPDGPYRLDDRRLDDFFAEVERIGMPILLHPNAGQTFRDTEMPAIELAVGVGCETARAVANLVMSGFFQQFPDLKVCLCHGGGAFLWLWPRVQQAAMRLTGDNSLPDSFSVDTAGLGGPQLDFVRRAVGDDRILFGSDLPATPDDWAREVIATVTGSGLAPRLLSNALAFLEPGAASADRATGTRSGGVPSSSSGPTA